MEEEWEESRSESWTGLFREILYQIKTMKMLEKLCEMKPMLSGRKRKSLVKLLNVLAKVRIKLQHQAWSGHQHPAWCLQKAAAVLSIQILTSSWFLFELSFKMMAFPKCCTSCLIYNAIVFKILSPFNWRFSATFSKCLKCLAFLHRPSVELWIPSNAGKRW